MNNLADATLDYLWFLTFLDEQHADPDVLLKESEGLIDRIENTFTSEEQEALKDAARRRLASWLHEPDEHGYTPRKLLTHSQRVFLEDMAAGEWWGSGR